MSRRDRRFSALLVICSVPFVLGLVERASGQPFVLSNGSGDGSLTVGVDGFGSFGSSIGDNASDAVYNPVGDIGPAGTVFESGLFISGPPAWLTSGQIGTTPALPNPTVTGNSTLAESSFTHGFLGFHLVQRLIDSFDNSGLRVGTVLEQIYQITNMADVPNSFGLTRYVDGDLLFDGTISDGGGRIVVSNNEILFETDAAAGSAASTTFVGITGTFSGRLGMNPIYGFEISPYSGLRTKIDQGGPLNNQIAGDTDGDQFIDTPYDVTLALSAQVQIPGGATATYTARTLFGNAVPPAPGSSEALPLLPADNEPPFIFDIDPEPGETIWIDPEIAIGYDYEILSGANFASMRMPSLAVVPQTGSYLVHIFDGGGFLPAVPLGPGEELLLGGSGASRFRVTGIDPRLGLDPGDPTAFPTGVSFVSAVSTRVSMTPLVVPEPQAVGLFALGILLLNAWPARRSSGNR